MTQAKLKQDPPQYCLALTRQQLILIDQEVNDTIESIKIVIDDFMDDLKLSTREKDRRIKWLTERKLEPLKEIQAKINSLLYGGTSCE